METIKLGKYVELAYEVFVVDEDGDASVAKFTREQPDSFIYGLEPGMIDGFTKKIANLEQGATFEFVLAPKDAFGEKDPSMVMTLDKDTFNVEGEFDTEKVYEGAMVPMMTADGYRVSGLVEKVTDDKVIIDFNHQLAGETVKYVGEVITVRDATPEELNPKHHQCDCGCDHDHGDGCGDGCDCGCGHDHGDDGCDCDHKHGDNCGCDDCKGKCE
jgi:FKBP-type peptidyl-prolyl cis-trans isomerase SlyD